MKDEIASAFALKRYGVTRARMRATDQKCRREKTEYNGI
jgi:hypothetical protein